MLLKNIQNKDKFFKKFLFYAGKNIGVLGKEPPHIATRELKIYTSRGG